MRFCPPLVTSTLLYEYYALCDMWQHSVWYKFTDVSEERSTFIFRYTVLCTRSENFTYIDYWVVNLSDKYFASFFRLVRHTSVARRRTTRVAE